MRGAEGEEWERHRGGVGGQNGRDKKGGRGRGERVRGAEREGWERHREGWEGWEGRTGEMRRVGGAEGEG